LNACSHALRCLISSKASSANGLCDVRCSRGKPDRSARWRV